MRAARFVGASVLCVLLTACGRFDAPQHEGTGASDGPGAPAARLAMSESLPSGGAAMAKGSAGEDGASDQVSFQSQAAASAQRYIIRDASVSVETADARRAAERLGSTAVALGGYVGNSSEEVDALGARSSTIQVRVPAKRFDDLMKSVDALGTVLSRNISTQDVTEEFVDTEARLRNLRNTEQRLLAHLAKTGKLSDTLLIERELARVRGEVEQHEGRMRYLTHSVSFSTATVVCRDKARREPVVPPASFSSAQVASGAARSVVELARGVWTLVIWVGVWSVVWLPFVLILVWASRAGSRRRRPGPPTES